MTRQTTRWRPDTHPGVEIDYEWDDALPEDQRVHTSVAARVNGKAHANHAALHAKVLGENQRKNIAVALLVENEPGLEPHEIEFNVEADGTVALKVPKLAAGKHAAHRARLSQRFGALVRLDQ